MNSLSFFSPYCFFWIMFGSARASLFGSGPSWARLAAPVQSIIVSHLCFRLPSDCHTFEHDYRKPFSVGRPAFPPTSRPNCSSISPCASAQARMFFWVNVTAQFKQVSHPLRPFVSPCHLTSSRNNMRPLSGQSFHFHAGHPRQCDHLAVKEICAKHTNSGLYTDHCPLTTDH